MNKEFNNLKEIEPYYDTKFNTYIFKENGKYINLIIFNFNLSIKSNIDANDIKARNINAYGIKAHDINAWDIDVNNINANDITAHNIKVDDVKVNNISVQDIDATSIIANNIYARNINYYIVCAAHKNIKCSAIKGYKENSKHFVLDGKIEVTE